MLCNARAAGHVFSVSASLVDQVKPCIEEGKVEGRLTF